MGLATLNGRLRELGTTGITPGGSRTQPQCYIRIPTKLMSKAKADTTTIKFYVLPDVTDSKSASYQSEAVIGRSASIKTYSHSDDRQIGIQLHFVTDCGDRMWENLMYLRMLQSAVYPQYMENEEQVPYYPPPVCKLVIGQLLGSCPLCAVLKSYSVRYPTDVAWDEITFLPQRFDVDTNWEVVYRPTNLPGQERILMDAPVAAYNAIPGLSDEFSQFAQSKFQPLCGYGY